MSRLLARPWLGPMSLLLCGLLSIATHAHAAEGDYRLGTHGEVLDDRVMYTIGGGSAVGSPSSLYRPSGLGVGGSWRANMMCGNMSLTNTLQNQLNGVTEGFQQIMGSIVQNATQAVMSLPALLAAERSTGTSTSPSLACPLTLWARSRFIAGEPMKPATKRLEGLS